MSMIKYMFADGMHYTSIGVRDYMRWSQMMIDEFGVGIKPSLRHILNWSLMLPEMMTCGREAKINCREFIGCGLYMNRDFKSAGEGALCPACFDQIRKGMHGGHDTGRACWIVAGTLCSGVRQETAAQKSEACISCDFYALVIDEENGDKITLLS